MTLVLMALLALAAGIWLTRPLWRGQVQAGQRRRAANVAAYRQRLAEIEADLGAGLLDAETATGLRAELDTRLVDDAGTRDEGPTGSQSRRPVLVALLGVFVLILAAAGYVRDGSWKVQQQIASGAGASPAASTAAADAGSVEEMVGKLRTRLEQEPADVNGWALLGRSEFMLQRYVESARAYGKANELTASQEPDLLVNEGEALALSRDRDLIGKPQQLFDAALALSPEHAKALWYSGLAAEQANDYGTALLRWSALARQTIPDELRPILAERLQTAAQQTGQPVPQMSAAPVPSAPAATVAEAPVKSPDPAGAAEAAGAVVIEVDVRLKPELQAQAASDATLFVFAKAASGPPMPLAVYRGKASELPRRVRLDDSMGMMPALKLSQFDRWTVTARLTRSGGVQAQSGDLQGSLTLGQSELGKGAMVLNVDEVVP